MTFLMIPHVLRVFVYSYTVCINASDPDGLLCWDLIYRLFFILIDFQRWYPKPFYSLNSTARRT